MGVSYFTDEQVEELRKNPYVKHVSNKAITYEDLLKLIDDYIDYYNNYRYQYELAKLSPNEFLEYYKTGKYPLADLIPEPEDIKEKIKNIKEDRLYQEQH